MPWRLPPQGGRRRQLVAFVRAFLADPAVLLLLDQGRIVEDGPPDELVRATGRYADLRQAWLDSLV